MQLSPSILGLTGFRSLAGQQPGARGFGSTFGAGSTDAVVTASIPGVNQNTWFIWEWANGGSSGGNELLATSGPFITIDQTLAAQLLFFFPFSSSSGHWSTSSNIITSGGWHAVGISYDASSTANNPSIYLDGALQTLGGSFTNTPVGSAMLANLPWYIGNNPAGTANWNGMLAMACHWRCLLSAGEHGLLARGAMPWRIRPDALDMCIPMWGAPIETDLVPRNANAAVTGTKRHAPPPLVRGVLEDDLFAMLVGAAGHLVTRDWYLPLELMLAARRDAALPLEVQGTLRNDAGATCEWLAVVDEDGRAGLEISGKLSRDTGAPIEFAARVARDGTAAVELMGAVGRDGSLPFEWSGALAVVADALLSFEWGRTLRSGGAAPYSFAAALSVDGGIATEILVVVRRAGAHPIAFDLAVCGDPDTPLEWYAPAVILHATLLALARRRLRMATPLPRHLTITFRPNIMSQTQDLSPPIDAVVEQEIVGFDFGPVLAAGVGITSVVGVTCAVYRGADTNPAARLLGAAQVAPSQATGAPNAQVNQLVGTMLAGATYRLQCTVTTGDGQTLDLWTHLACVAVI